jgi:hypothetical protein
LSIIAPVLIVNIVKITCIEISYLWHAEALICQISIIAGCNGAGKTTASFTVLPELLDCDEFINADEIAIKDAVTFEKLKNHDNTG